MKDFENIKIVNEDLKEKIYSKYKDNLFSKFLGRDYDYNCLISIKEGKDDQLISILLPNYNQKETILRSSKLIPQTELVEELISKSDFEDGKKSVKDVCSNLINKVEGKINCQFVEAMGQVVTNNDSVVNYGVATGDELDTWNTNNADRILYGSKKSNLVVGNHSASLSNINLTDDKLNSSIVSLAKDMAQSANPAIRPIEDNNGNKWFIMFCDSFAFRDLKNDPIVNQANLEARQIDPKNPLFGYNDLVYKRVILKEIPETANFLNPITHVRMSFLCGQQAIICGFVEPILRERLLYYNFQLGVASQLKHKIQKASLDGKQYGMVTVFTSSALDK